jgi:hypothetical protein
MIHNFFFSSMNYANSPSLIHYYPYSFLSSVSSFCYFVLWINRNEEQHHNPKFKNTNRRYAPSSLPTTDVAPLSLAVRPTCRYFFCTHPMELGVDGRAGANPPCDAHNDDALGHRHIFGGIVMALHMFIHLSNGEPLGMIHQIGWWRSDNVVSSL